MRCVLNILLINPFLSASKALSAGVMVAPITSVKPLGATETE
jgi:hypothetical protein